MKSILTLYRYTAAELAAITGGTLAPADAGDVGFDRVVTDSREAEPGALFLAIPGERVDGHRFIPAAAELGARVFLCLHLPDVIPAGCAFVCVPDVVLALGALATDYAARTPGYTVAVTGSVGKTTTKEFISAVLSRRMVVHKSTGNHNNEIGMPMMVLAAPADVGAKVYEMGMCGLGEIDYLTRIARPDVAVITTIGSSHLEQLGSRENICRAKCEIAHGLGEGGVLLCNGDEPLLCRDEIEGVRPTHVACRLRTADFRAVNIRPGVGKTVFDLIYGNRAVTNVEIPAMGIHNVYAALFAYAVGVECGMDDGEIRAGLLAFENTGMRQHLIDVGGVAVIEDCYNASPESMRAALEVLCELSRQRGGARTLALLGDMRELGRDSMLMHQQLGIALAQKKIDYLFTIGTIAEEIAAGAIHNGMRADHVYVNPDTEKPNYSGEMLLDVLRPGDILLVKASRAVAAERVIDYLREHASRIGH